MTSVFAPAVQRGRALARITTKHHFGPGPQVDDHASIIAASDPSLTDPFLVMMEDWFSQPGFEWHPHRGLETITTVLDGVLEHGDTLGNSGALHPGDIQWMTAGRGIIHRELAFRNEFAHTLQLWLNLPRQRKMAPTGYQNLLSAGRPHVTLPGVDIDVIAGTVHGTTAPTQLQWPVQGAIVTIDPATPFAYELPADHRAFVYVLSGRLVAGNQVMGDGDTGWSDPVADDREPSTLLLVTSDAGIPTRVMIFSGPPIGEPVVLGGPFVMNTQDEITAAFTDFRAGRFGEVPRQARLAYDR